MKLTISLLSIITAVAVATHGANDHPCAYYASKVPKLKSCATATQFCRQFLDSRPTFTKTVTKVVSTRTVPKAHTIRTSKTTSFSTATSTVTIRSYDSDCGTVTMTTRRKLRRHAATVLERAPDPSCGIIPKASPSRVSGACSCILAKTDTVRTTRVVSKGTTTRTVTSTETKTTVVEESTTPPGACSGPIFRVVVSNAAAPELNNQNFIFSGGNSTTILTRFADAMSIRDGYLYYPGTGAFLSFQPYPFSSDPAYYLPRDDVSPRARCYADRNFDPVRLHCLVGQQMESANFYICNDTPGQVDNFVVLSALSNFRPNTCVQFTPQIIFLQ